jgi:hypothetical protein
MKNKKIFKVYINLNLVATVDTEDRVWEVIGSYPFGSLYEVHDENDEIVAEFVPF